MNLNEMKEMLEQREQTIKGIIKRAHNELLVKQLEGHLAEIGTMLTYLEKDKVYSKTR